MEKNVQISKELQEISPLVAKAGALNVFEVPVDYFDGLAENIVDFVQGNLSGAGAVPMGYFDNLSNAILSKIDGTVANELLQISPFVAQIEKSNPFVVPVNYFENLSDNVDSNIEKDVLPAVLHRAATLPAYIIPAGYFEELPEIVLQKAKQESGAKIIALPKRRTSFYKYAAAAVFTGAMFFGVYKYSDNSASTPSVTTGATASVEKMDDKKFEERINDLNEDEIVKYLEKNGSETDLAALASGIDENSLPTQEEYLTDDAVLDNFLKEINTNN